MRRHLARMAPLAGLALCAASFSSGDLAAAAPADVSRPAVNGGTWGDAMKVPGTAALNGGTEAAVEAVSCAAPGNCAAGGYYADKDSQIHGFVDIEVSGTWQVAQKVPGLAAFGKGSSEVTAISCGGPGHCVAVGWTYTGAFAVRYVNGRWHNAVEIRRAVTGRPSISCPSAGNCAAGGSYIDAKRHTQAFVVREVRGTWRKAVEVPGSASLNSGGYAQVNSVSCASSGNCAVVGFSPGNRRPGHTGRNLVGVVRRARQVRRWR